MNLFAVISAEVAKGELCERYLLVGDVFSIAFPTPVIEELLVMAGPESTGVAAHQTMESHFYTCNATSIDVLFRNNASGEFHFDGIIVEFEIKLIRSEMLMYRVHFKRLDAAHLKHELRDLQEQVSILENKA
jgi:hypothetical protein